ncbi:AraC family ligand binding domain-containing protein [Lichenibacterium minor]|uniref:AraC family ligand binding domain-containing protein n=1 Tax=Lichenibacterium minor TaxID=2316528 RepID=UPI001FE00484|nr:AraC family ligand binding domain-containing protein [Lichenibacterium minor]
MTLSTDRSFPRHAHDHLGFGVVAFGGHRSWSGSGTVEAAAGDCIMVNPGEIHDGIAVDGGTRGWPPSPGAPGPAAPSATRSSRPSAASPRDRLPVEDVSDLVVDDAAARAEALPPAGHAGQAVVLGGPNVGADLHGFAHAGHGFLLQRVGDDGLRGRDAGGRGERCREGEEDEQGSAHGDNVQVSTSTVHRDV